MFVFRNNTVERFFPKDYAFSGYDDISYVPTDVDGYVWFYQLPVKYDQEILCSEIRGYAQKIQFVLAQVDKTKPFIAFTMDENTYAVPFTSGNELVAAVAEYNTVLVQVEAEHSNVKLLDIREFTRQYPANEVFDWKFWFIAQMGMNPKVTKPFIEWYNHKLEQIALKRKKCLVLDLDNTLWGGVLGEDGIEGIKLGGDYFPLLARGIVGTEQDRCYTDSMLKEQRGRCAGGLGKEPLHGAEEGQLCHLAYQLDG